ncbi:MAG: transcriptional antiterminator, Rof [Betaproteobacteria bacterium]|nr:transcriptional antiterminator, Rof [Betaproteobacteria bacterium]
MEPYQPVSCDLHSRLELAILRRRTLHLEWKTGPGLERRQAGTGIGVDIYTRDGAEWLEVDLVTGERLRLRLDQMVVIDGV